MPLNGRVVTIHVLSADHRYAPLDDIARLSGATDLGPTLMRSLAQVRGVMVLRTCNRVTIYVDAPASADPHALKDAVERELATASGTPRADVQLRHLWGRAGLVDLFATASGLESMVIGEREIAGQMRRAARTAWEDGTLSCDLGRAAERASATSRRVATETGLAGAGRSVVAVQPKGGQVVVSTGTTPVDRYCRTKAPSSVAGRSGSASDPMRTGRPATWTLSLKAVGTPAKGACAPAPPGSGAIAAARSRARSVSRTVVAPSSGSTAATRAMAASTASVALIRPARISSATPVASREPSASSR